MLTVRTPASFVLGRSVNLLDFNEHEDRIVSKHHSNSVFPPGKVRLDSLQSFERAVSRITSKTYSDLCQCMISNHCNKSTAHNYTQLYHEFLGSHRSDQLDFLEVGIGTNNQDVPSRMAATYSPGASLRGWRTYFDNPEMVVVGADVDPRVLFSEDRIATAYINQLNPSSIYSFVERMGFARKGLDFVLDDGLHEYRSNLALLIGLWPFLKSNGLYVIEDMVASTFSALIKFIGELSLGADWCACELPSEIKSDNRVIILQKL
jgi:hypothetical protein